MEKYAVIEARNVLTLMNAKFVSGAFVAMSVAWVLFTFQDAILLYMYFTYRLIRVQVEPERRSWLLPCTHHESISFCLFQLVRAYQIWSSNRIAKVCKPVDTSCKKMWKKNEHEKYWLLLYESPGENMHTIVVSPVDRHLFNQQCITNAKQTDTLNKRQLDKQQKEKHETRSNARSEV